MKLSDLLKEFGDIELNKENESKIYTFCPRFLLSTLF